MAGIGLNGFRLTNRMIADLPKRSSMLNDTTPVILTLNEESNIGRSLEGLRWAKRVVILDSVSSDKTKAISESFPNVKFIERPFDSHAEQWNHAVFETGIETPWILALDADYMVGDKLMAEIETLDPADGISCFFARFAFAIHGRVLPGSLYPSIAVLFRRDRCRYVQDGHTQRLSFPGRSDWLHTPIVLDDRKSVMHWISSQSRYARLEAEKLLSTPRAELPSSDRIRLLRVVAPFVVLGYTALVKRCLFAGRAGLFYMVQRVCFECMLSLCLLEHDLTHPAAKT